MVLRAIPPSKINLRLSLQLLLLMGALVIMGGIEHLWKRPGVSSKVYLTDVDNPDGVGAVEATDVAEVDVTPKHYECGGKPFAPFPEDELRGGIALVTGVAGFIGSHVAEHCLRLGLKVIGLDDLSGGYLRQNVPEGVRFVHGSVSNPILLDKLFRRYRFDYVYHLAGHGSVRLSHHLRSFTYANEVVGSSHLINAVVRTGETKCFVYLSSAAVYGDMPSYSTIYTENDYPHPDSPYGISKLAVENDIVAAHKRFGLNYIILRAHNVYGPRMNIRDPHHGIVGAFLMAHLAKNKPLLVFGDGTQKHAFTYVDDLAEVISMAPTVRLANNQTFNAGSDDVSSINDLIAAVKNAMGSEWPTSRVKEQKENYGVVVDHTKFRCTFGDRKWMSLQNGLQETVPWVMRIFAGLSPDEVANLLQRKCLEEVELKFGIKHLGDLCNNLKEVLAVEKVATLGNVEESLRRFPGRIEKL